MAEILRYALLKRLMDLSIALVSITLLLPVMAVIAVLVRIKLGTPIFFRQTRAGLNGKPFTMVKFRTMKEACAHDGSVLPDELRITSFGRMLRNTSLDELPELWNVLVGDMSLVGPRPLLMDYLPLYTPDQARRHEVKPGITGWAQVNGRNAITWEEKFDLDVWYVDHRSILLDFRILLRTVEYVVLAKHINHAQSATMERFRGSVRK